MTPPIPIPDDVRAWRARVFAGCNERVSNLVTDVPTTHETPLDMTFIQHFLGVSAPHRLPSDWTVQFSTHYFGGGVDHRAPPVQLHGRLALQGARKGCASVRCNRRLRDTAGYPGLLPALQPRDRPVDGRSPDRSAGASAPFERCWMSSGPSRETALGSRTRASGRRSGLRSTHDDIACPFRYDRPSRGVAFRALRCEPVARVRRGGYIAESPNDPGLDYVFRRRNGPIAAALAVTLDAP